MVQKELKEALRVWDEKIDSDIYLIPLCLERCDVPENLKKFQWVDLYSHEGFERLCLAIEEGIKRSSLNTLSSVSHDGVSIMSNTYADKEYVNNLYSIDIRYPTFKGEFDKDIGEINTRILSVVYENAEKSRRVIFEEARKFDKNTAFPSCEISGDFQVTTFTKSLISVMFDFISCYWPSAHPTKWRECLNFSLNPVVELEINDIMELRKNTFPSFLDKVRDKLTVFKAETSLGLDHEVEDVISHLRNFDGLFNIWNNRLIFSYTGPFVFGVMAASVPIVDVSSFINPYGPLADVLEAPRPGRAE